MNTEKKFRKKLTLADLIRDAEKRGLIKATADYVGDASSVVA